MAESYRNGSKILREKEKLLVTSNFSFSHRVFRRLVLQTCKKQGLFGKGLNLTDDRVVDGLILDLACPGGSVVSVLDS